MRWNPYIAVSAALVFAACSVDRSDIHNEHMHAIPDLTVIGMELLGDAHEGYSATGMSHLVSHLTDDDVTSVQQAMEMEESGPEYLGDMRESIMHLNHITSAMLEPLFLVIKEHSGKTRNDAVRVWLKEHKGLIYRLTIRKLSADMFGWRVEAKKSTAQDREYALVFGGYTKRLHDDPPHYGWGDVGVNLDTMKSIDPTFMGQGQFYISFDRTADTDKMTETKKVQYRLVNFTMDPTMHEGMNAVFVAHKVMEPDGSMMGGARVSGHFNMMGIDNATDEKMEHVRLRGMSMMHHGGMAQAVAVMGDIPENEYYRGISCWDHMQMETYKKLTHFACAGENYTSCTETVKSESGDAANCHMPPDEMMQLEPTDDLNSTEDEMGAPTVELMPLPTAVPEGV